ncbi:MAG: sensor histidine kinase [Bacteroidetes bacterium]|nr:sensor histidine kinase [Bacteroidota bacterium]
MEATPELNFLNTLLPLAGILFVIATGVILLNQHFHKNLYRQKLEQEELKTLHQQQLLQSSIQVQEEERKRIAQDLHDELGAALSIARMHLVQLEQQSADKSDGILSALKNVRTLTESSLASMRRISHELMPPQLEAFGLIKTLKAMADQINSTNKITINILSSELPELSWPINVGLYRVSMELIHNTIKHAQATEAHIELTWDGHSITLQYSDNGKGLPENTTSTGLGLKSIEARTNSLHGTLTLGTGESGGFCAVVKIPFSR